MKFAFVMNPIGGVEVIKKIRNIRNLWGTILSLDFWHFLFLYSISKECKKAVPYFAPRVLYTFENVTSRKGASASGKIVGIMMSPKQILVDQQMALEMIQRSYQKLQRWDVDILGLGGLTGVIGSNGQMINKQIPAAVTTGTSYLVYTSVKTLERALEKVDQMLTVSKVAIIGFPGSIGAAIAHMLAMRGANLKLVGRTSSKPVQELASVLRKTHGVEVDLSSDFREVLEEEKIIVCASSREGFIGQDQFSPGSIVVDVSMPKNVRGVKAERTDVLVIDGGIVGLPEETTCERDLFGFGRTNILACFAEPIVLALEERKESFSIGRKLDVNKIEEIGRIGEEHGFAVRDLISFDRVIPDEVFEKVRRILN